MTTQAELHQMVRLRVGQKDALNKLNGALATPVTTIVCEHDTTNLGQGNRVSVDMEDYHVWSNAASTKTLTVETVQGTAAAHADDTLVRVEPQFSPYEIGQAVNDELASLPGEGVFKWSTVVLTGSTDFGYDLTSVGTLLGVHRVRVKRNGSDGRWDNIPHAYWRVMQKMDADEFASSEALFVHGVEQGLDVNVLYKAPFTALNLTTAGLAESVETISGCDHVPLLAVGAAIRLLLGRSAARTHLGSQGDTRRAEEVSASDAQRALAPLQVERSLMLARVRRDQQRKYGI